MNKPWSRTCYSNHAAAATVIALRALESSGLPPQVSITSEDKNLPSGVQFKKLQQMRPQ